MKYMILLILVGCAFWLFKKKQRKSYINNIILPAKLGVHREIPLEKQISYLDKALDSNFAERIRQRYMGEHKKIRVEEYNLLFFELKRFFIMCSLLKNVPMFSDRVDAIWHEMLMFTKEYEQFSERVYGQFLHHAPAEVKAPEPHNRAFFDLMYTQLFEFTLYTPIAWGAFFRNPLDPEQIDEILSSTPSELRQKYFREDADNNTVQALINQLKSTIKDSINKKSMKIETNHYKNITKHSSLLMGAMIYYFMKHPEEYAKYMIPAHVSAASNCVSSGCSSCSSHHSSHCGSSCGSSCSSCSS
ncbi:MAG: hypothetical protein ACO1OT_00270 [Heyndrickxia sp.]